MTDFDQLMELAENTGKSIDSLKEQALRLYLALLYLVPDDKRNEIIDTIAEYIIENNKKRS